MSTFQPFGSTSSLWTPPTPPPPSVAGTTHSAGGIVSRQTTPPSEAASPVVATPKSGSEPALWSDRYRSLSTGNIGGMTVTESGLGVTPANYTEPRRVLGDLPQNTVTSHALASPFMPGLNNGPWGTPMPLRQNRSNQRNLTVEERLALAEDKIRELMIENNRLREKNAFSHRSDNTNIYSTPSFCGGSPMIFDNLNTSFASSGYGQIGGLGLQRFDDPEICYDLSRMHMAPEDSLDKGTYTAPSYITIPILQGSFNFADMPNSYIRPIVWIIAHRIPKGSGESSGLKSAVNALASRLGLPRSMDPAATLISCIIEWAKPLCYTSCGNYLCQQLIERGDMEDKEAFIQAIHDDIVPIASDKFGTHVLCKAVTVRELEAPIAEALIKFGIFDSMRTGARRLWREYLEKCRQGRQFDIFYRINEVMAGKWSDLACINELLADIARVANNQFGHFVVTKLIGYPNLYRATCEAILTSYPPVATTHHGVNFAKIALTEGGRGSIMKYIDAICSHDQGRTPGIVAIATSSIGKAHLTFVLSCLTPSEHVRVRQTCRAYSTTLRNSQSGNDLLRSLGLMHAVGSRHRAGSN
ncbi:hypothetical protein I316_00961 [Kwoniella heveanensis BCC8398]|uniref:PUM-HD domain-containing protein n=1 Tax=Kwoniella heveanensis BCC8398 TaxID=1296120 RepID=A0A1B9H1A1_9TREE|nr:hypothetical protein I316_00961 [Kwoniella heveanensis BCC8398]